ncbi:UDP-N-acetylglucosamine pyrophosphorylase [Thermodesulfobacteriota bacterium]
MPNPEKGIQILNQLQDKGVRIPCPGGVEIGSDILLERISGDGVVIHAGCKLSGPDTLIMPGAQLGEEAPVTVHNCQLGKDVHLRGGFFCESVFLEKASMGSGAQVREACLLEEGARGAHTVGLKHTILFPFVTLGSLINFCDCLMAGGTDERNHSEVGSSYIHFNYTPDQDKATPSLLGDVPRGVMMNRSPIFLGGQGGIVGPVVMEYGTVVVSGTIVRKDIMKENSMLLGHSSLSKTIPYRSGLYSNIKRIVKLNTVYIANLLALRRWYQDVRSRFMGRDNLEKALHEGAVEKLELAIGERVKRLGDVARKMPRSIESHKNIPESSAARAALRKEELLERWQDMERVFKESFEKEGDSSKRDRFLEVIEKAITRNGNEYIRAIKGLSEKESHEGVSWLEGIVDDVCKSAWSLVPSMDIKS